MKTSLLLILLAAIAALASCTHESVKNHVPREGEDGDHRHIKGTWLPHNS